MTELTAARLRHLLDYDGTTGIFRRRIARGPSPAGAKAGSPTSGGYIQLIVDRRNYKAHRLAWLWTFGEWPDGEIDHINGVPWDNRIANLRVATSAQQKANARQRQNTISGMRGVYLDKRDGRWYAQVGVAGRTVSLGRFKTPREARAAYVEAATNIYGEFLCLTR